MQIPVFSQNQVQPNALPQVGIQRVQNRIGDALSMASDAAQQIIDEETKRADQVAYMEADTKLATLKTKLLSDPETGQIRKRGKDAIGSGDEYLTQFDEQAAAIGGELKNGRQRRAYQQSLTQHREGLNSALSSHEGAEREKYYTSVRESFQAQKKSAAIESYEKPDVIEQNIIDLEASVRATPGLDDNQKAMAASLARSNTYVDVIDRYLANEKVDGAEKFYKSIGEKVVGDDRTNIEAKIRAAREREKQKKDASLAELKYSIAQSHAELVATHNANLPIDSVRSEAEYKLLGPRGADMYKEAIAMQKQSLVNSTLHTMPSSKIAEEVGKLRPTKQGGILLQSDLYSAAGKAAQQILHERKTDGVGYLQARDPTVGAAYLAFVENPNDVTRAEYFASLKTAKTQYEMPSQDLLSRGEEGHIVNQMTVADDSKSLVAAINGVKQAYGDDFDLIYDQVADKLPDTSYLIPYLPEKGANILSAMAFKKPDELKVFIPNGMTVTDVRSEVASGLDELRRSFPVDGISGYAKIQSATEKLAIGYMAQGMAYSTAIKQAVADTTHADNFAEIRNESVRIPKVFKNQIIDDNKVVFGMNAALNKFQAPDRIIEKGSIHGDEVEKEFLSEDIRDNGYFKTSPNGDGVWLYLRQSPVGRPPISYTWQQLIDMSVVEEDEQMRQKFKEDLTGIP